MHIHCHNHTVTIIIGNIQNRPCAIPKMGCHSFSDLKIVFSMLYKTQYHQWRSKKKTKKHSLGGGEVESSSRETGGNELNLCCLSRNVDLPLPLLALTSGPACGCSLANSLWNFSPSGYCKVAVRTTTRRQGETCGWQHSWPVQGQSHSLSVGASSTPYLQTHFSKQEGCTASSKAVLVFPAEITLAFGTAGLPRLCSPPGCSRVQLFSQAARCCIFS